VRVRDGGLGVPEKAMNWQKWLAVLFVMLALSGCASMATDQVQAPVPSHSHDDGPDMRTGNMGK